MFTARRCAALAVTALTGSLVTLLPTAAHAVGAAQPTVVSAVPAAYTPAVDNGVVYAIGQAGSTVFLGGSFTSVTPHGSSTAVTQNYITAFTAGTGAMVTSFAPTLNGTVDTIIPGPTAGTVYVGGAFKTVDGATSHLALLNASTGAIVPGWTSPAIDGEVDAMGVADNQLFVGGDFDAVGGQKRGGFATLNPTTGAVTSYSTLSFTGHHNYGTNCNPSKNTCATGGVGVRGLDVNPAGTRLIAIGNFTNVSGSARDQIAMIDLSSSSAAVDPNWATDAFTASCASGSFDSWIRDVQFSPDGSYFAIASAGGGMGTKNSDGTLGLCDSVSRFETSGTGSDVQPTWVDWTGNDSFWSVAVSGTAIYVGGHQRWLNNSKGEDYAAEGSVPRPGLAAVDPVNGMPLAWNPGRNPRGNGAYALLATADGLYVGSDTDWIGNYQYDRPKNAFFPLAGGEKLPANTLGSLPGNVYLVGRPSDSGNVESVSWDGSSAPGSPTTFTGIDWSTVRGAFAVNGQVYYASTDGNFYQRSFDGHTFGAATAIDPYDDPTWSNVRIGGNTTTTYRGVKSSFYGEMSSLTSLFYTGGRIYYTLSGSSHMYYRYFETDDGVIGSDEFTTTDGLSWNNIAGAFISGSTLYYSTSSGTLMQVPWSNGQASGTPTTTNSAINWASHGAFVLSGSQVAPNQPPVAAFTASCTTTANPCSFDGSGSSDPDGTVASYAWTFGDGGTATGVKPTHTYAAAGDYNVTLTVTDNNGATNSVTHSVHVSSTTAQPVAFRAAATYDANTTSASVTVPSSVQSGDEMLLFATWASSSGVTATAPSGWTTVGTTNHSNLLTAVYARSATSSDAGSKVTVPLSGTVKASLSLAAYANADSAIESSASSTDTSTSSHKSPTLSGLSAGSYVVTFWGDKSTGTTSWTAPSGVTQRAVVYGSGSGEVTALTADSGSAVSGSYGGLTATTNVASGSGASWTIALQPAG